MDEQLERFKEFMVRQQAQSAEKLSQLEDLLVRFVQATRDRFAENERRAQESDRRSQEADRRSQELDEKLAALTNAQIRAEDGMSEMRREAEGAKREAKERSEDIDRKIAALVDAQMRTEETVKKMSERIDKLGERVDNLTVVVGRHVADGHGGTAQTEA